MKALFRSTWFRFVLLLTLAAFLAAGAAVPVGAVEQTIDYPVSLYMYQTGTNPSPSVFQQDNANSLTSTTCARFGPCIEFQHTANTSYVVVVTLNQSSAINSLIYSDVLAMAHLSSGEAASILFPGNIYDATIMQASIDTNTATYIFTYNTSSIENADTFDRVYFAWNTQFGSGTYRITVKSATAYAIYDPPGTTLEDIEIQINQIINNQIEQNTTINNKLDEVISNSTSTNANIVAALNDIITNQETQNNNWQTLITYGNDYNQIDQTTINNFGTAQDNLSSAEGALQDKSKSLIAKASSGVQKATTASQTLVTSLTTTVPQVVTFATDIITTTPPEVQAAVLAIPLLSFAAWLIGLKK